LKKKLILCSLAIVFLALALLFGVVRFSSDNIENRKNDYKNLVLENLTVAGETRVIDGYVNNVKVNGSAGSVFATTINGEIIFPSSVEQKNDDVYYSFDTYAHGIVVKSANEARVEVNPTSLNVNVMLTFFIFVLPLVLAWAIYNAIEDKVAFKKDVVAIKRYKYLLSDLVTRDIKTKYRRSALGVLWSVLNPLLMMLVLTAVFSKIIRVEVEGGFALFYLTGYIIFNFISESSNFSLTSMINAGGLIKKVYIPKYIFPLEKTIFSLVNMLFSLIAFVLVFGIFLATGKVEIHATMLLFFIPMIYIFIFAFGLNLILSTLNVFFRDVGHLWGVFVTVWMYATPIIYPINIVPEWLQSIIRFNPLYHYVTYFRNVMIYGTVPSLTDNLICFGFSLIFLLVGITVFRKNQDKFVLHI
jgi:ABC-2 type transport system permease protein